MLWRKTFIHLISSISKRKKLSVSMRNQTSDLLIPGFKPLSLNQRGSLTRILHTATISNVENVIFVNRQEKFTLFFIMDSKMFTAKMPRALTYLLQAPSQNLKGIFSEKNLSFSFILLTLKKISIFSTIHIEVLTVQKNLIMLIFVIGYKKSCWNFIR